MSEQKPFRELSPEEQVDRVMQFVAEFVERDGFELLPWQREWVKNWWLRGTPNPLRRSA